MAALPFYITLIVKTKPSMNDKIYQSVKWIAIGILIGYAGKYALALIKAKRDQESTIALEDNYTTNEH